MIRFVFSKNKKIFCLLSLDIIALRCNVRVCAFYLYTTTTIPFLLFPCLSLSLNLSLYPSTSSSSYSFLAFSNPLCQSLLSYIISNRDEETIQWVVQHFRFNDGRSILNDLVCSKINWQARNTMICICIGAFSVSLSIIRLPERMCILIATRQGRFPFFVLRSFDVCHDRHWIRQDCRHLLHSTICIFFRLT